MLKADLNFDEINNELTKTDQINYIAALYQVPTWRVKQKIKQGVSLFQLEDMFEFAPEL